MNRLRRLQHDESGMSYAFIGMGMMAFLSASMLAIDVGMLMTSRGQAQNSADAGALAGATALVFNNYNDRTPTGPAVTHAKAAAAANQVMGKNVSVIDSDITFPTGPTGLDNRVQVNVFRTAERGNPVSTLIAKFFGIATSDIDATATAEASKANAMTCVKPFTIPDRWIEKHTPGFDPTDTYEAYTNKGVPLTVPDVYIPANKPGYTGYNAMRDQGMRLMIRAGTGMSPRPGTLRIDDSAVLFSRPAMANVCPSRSSTSVSARREVSAGMRKPPMMTALLKSSELTSGLIFRLTRSPPSTVGVKLRRTPYSLK